MPIPHKGDCFPTTANLFYARNIIIMRNFSSFTAGFIGTDKKALWFDRGKKSWATILTTSLSWFIFLVSPLALLAQFRVNGSQIQSKGTDVLLAKAIKQYSLLTINTPALRKYVKLNKATAIEFTLELEGYAPFVFKLRENDILTAGYKCIIGRPNGRETLGKPECITYVGTIDGDEKSWAYLTITDNMVYGLFNKNGRQYFIEPLQFFDRSQSNKTFVVYETKNVVPKSGISCGVTEAMERARQTLSVANGMEINPATNGTATGTCKMVELAIASDSLMLAKFQDVATLQERNIGVVNTMVGIYSNAQFGTSYLEFKIVGQYIATTSSNDPLIPAYNGPAADTLLQRFGAWAEAGNFGLIYDLGEMWTARDIELGGGYSVIGNSNTGSICTPLRYSVLEANSAFTSYENGLLAAHETGHTLNAVHDPSGYYVMSPFLSPYDSVFSTASMTAIKNYLATISCLSACNAQLPVAQFNKSKDNICTGDSIQFTDASVGQVTSRTWSFPGGTPAQSTSASPVVTYSTPGAKSATLMATNVKGTNSVSKPIFVSNPSVNTCKPSIGFGNDSAILFSFSLADINYGLSSFVFYTGQYDDVSCSSNAILLPATTYNAQINVGSAADQSQYYNTFSKFQVFIDYNNDGDFTDADENVFSLNSCVRGIYNFKITTPSNPPVMNQWLRLRVVALGCKPALTDGCHLPVDAKTNDFAVAFVSSNVLKVSLINFTGVHENDVNKLQWQTASELNNSRFEVERSFNGTDFERIGTVNGVLTSNTLRDYSFNDSLRNALGQQVFYYRLKTVDTDGNFEYSNIILLNNVDNVQKIRVYPNPVNRGENMTIILPSTNSVKLEIFNSIGRLMYARNATAAGGQIGLNVPANWASGIYIVRLANDNFSSSQMLLIK